MISCRSMVLMQFFEIFDEVMYPLRIKELECCQTHEMSNFMGNFTLRITWEGSVLSIALIYWAMALS